MLVIGSINSWSGGRVGMCSVALSLLLEGVVLIVGDAVASQVTLQSASVRQAMALSPATIIVADPDGVQPMCKPLMELQHVLSLE
ncbi:hypothetical protein PG994_015052 [Apiospora phragmitis]|uniref:Uncharacterized protein n=1 Tax=Apiospora phragmitis TaxID=2905665 RepID=A0ABR1SX65_9PEZI